MQALEALPEVYVKTTDVPDIVDWSDPTREVLCRSVWRQIPLRLKAGVIA